MAYFKKIKVKNTGGALKNVAFQIEKKSGNIPVFHQQILRHLLFDIKQQKLVYDFFNLYSSVSKVAANTINKII
jgi:hypothetical protein